MTTKAKISKQPFRFDEETIGISKGESGRFKNDSQ